MRRRTTPGRAAPLILRPEDRARPRHVPTDHARVIEALLPDLHHIARRLAPSAQAADDLVQATLLQMWSRLSDPSAGDIHDLRSLAFGILREVAGPQPQTKLSA